MYIIKIIKIFKIMVDKISKYTYEAYDVALAAEIKSCFPFIEKDEEFWHDIVLNEEEFWAVFLAHDGKQTVAQAAEEYANMMDWSQKLTDRVAFAKKNFNEKRPRFMVDEEELAPFYYGEFCLALLKDGFIGDNRWTLIDIIESADYKELARWMEIEFEKEPHPFG